MVFSFSNTRNYSLWVVVSFFLFLILGLIYSPSYIEQLTMDNAQWTISNAQDSGEWRMES